ncbi:MAG: helix-turn-helix transcriptional regulator [Rubricoccaceae bacterium]
MPHEAFGPLLRRWRHQRCLTQEALADQAALSTRHLSFLETERARPSQPTVLQLADALDIPLRERNVLLEAAGFARLYPEASLSDSELEFHRQLVQSVLDRHDPFFAVAIDRLWTIQLRNDAADRFLAPFASSIPGPPNLARLLVHPSGLGPMLVNRDEVAIHFLARLERESAARPNDAELAALMDEMASYGPFRAPLVAAPSDDLALPLKLAINGHSLRLIGGVLAFDGARSPALDELRIETFFPADQATADVLHAL